MRKNLACIHQYFKNENCTVNSSCTVWMTVALESVNDESRCKSTIKTTEYLHVSFFSTVSLKVSSYLLSLQGVN